MASYVSIDLHRRRSVIVVLEDDGVLGRRLSVDARTCQQDITVQFFGLVFVQASR